MIRNFTQAGKNLYRKLIIYSYIKILHTYVNWSHLNSWLCMSSVYLTIGQVVMLLFLHALLHWNWSCQFHQWTSYLDKPNGQLSDPIIFPSCLGMSDIAKHLLCWNTFHVCFLMCLIHFFFSPIPGLFFFSFCCYLLLLFLCQALNIQGMSLIQSSILVPVILSFYFLCKPNPVP